MRDGTGAESVRVSSERVSEGGTVTHERGVSVRARNYSVLQNLIQMNWKASFVCTTSTYSEIPEGESYFEFPKSYSFPKPPPRIVNVNVARLTLLSRRLKPAGYERLD